MVTALRWLGYAWLAYFAVLSFGTMGLYAYRWGARLLRRLGLVTNATYEAIYDRTERWSDITIASRWNPFLLPLWLVATALELLARATIPDADDPPTARGHQPHGASVWRLPAHLLEQLKHKVISPKTMTVPLRLITGVAASQLIATGVLLFVTRIDLDTVRISPAGPQEIHISAWVFWPVVAFLALAWSFVASGAIVMRGRFRWLVLAVLAWTTHPPLTGDPFMTAWIVWLAVIAAIMSRPRFRSSDDPASAPGFALLTSVGLWVFAYFALAAWEVEHATGIPFPEWFADRMLALTVFLIPLIFLAGAEMGEIGTLVGTATVSAFERVAKGWGALMASIAVGAATLWWVVPQILAMDRGWFVNLVSYGLTALALLFLLVFVAPVTKLEPGEVPYGALATAAVGLAGAHILISLILSAWSFPAGAPLHVEYVVHRETEPAPFSISVPKGTAISAVDVPNSIAFVRGILGSTAYIVVSRYPDDGPDRKRVADDEALIRHFWRYASGIDAIVDNEQLRAYEYEFPAIRDETHCVGIVPKMKTERWLVQACSMARHWRYYSRVLLPSLRSFRTGFSAETLEPVNVTGLAQALARTTGFSLMPLILAFVGARLHGWRNDPDDVEDFPVVSAQRLRAGVFMFTIAALAVGFFPFEPFTVVGNTASAPLSPMKDLLATTAVFSIIFSLYAAVRALSGKPVHNTPELFAANIGLVLLAWLYDLYGRALDLQETSMLLAACVLIATLLWDLAMSGHPITNLSSPAFPRPARILLWAGYVTMVGTAILFYSSHVASAGERLRGMFESDETVRQGILWLGSAVLVSTLLTGLMRRTQPPHEEH